VLKKVDTAPGGRGPKINLKKPFAIRYDL
jgi:hypothetical protein